jgi:hypothetical protein
MRPKIPADVTITVFLWGQPVYRSTITPAVLKPQRAKPHGKLVQKQVKNTATR